MNSDATVIYYTANKENPIFEKKIQENILKNCGGLPIISVSQKPIDFGINICIGDVGTSGFNCIRQMLIAAEAASTKYVISAEADCLYPPDYFEFRPKKDDACYRNNNTYLIGYTRDYFWKKDEGGTWSQVINREFYLKRLHLLFEGEPKWSTEKKNFPKEKGLNFFDSFETFTTANPCISFKTGKGMRRFSHSSRVPIYSLPFWGRGIDIYNYYIKDVG